MGYYKRDHEPAGHRETYSTLLRSLAGPHLCEDLSLIVNPRMSIKLPKNLQSSLVSVTSTTQGWRHIAHISLQRRGCCPAAGNTGDRHSLAAAPARTATAQTAAFLRGPHLGTGHGRGSKPGHSGPRVTIPMSPRLPTGLSKACEDCIPAQLCPLPHPARFPSCAQGSILNKRPVHLTLCHRLLSEEPMQ